MNITRGLFSALLFCFIVFFSCQNTGRKKSVRENVQITQVSLQGPTAIADHWELKGEAVNEPGYDL